MISVSIVASVDVSSVAKSIQQPGVSLSVSLGSSLGFRLSGSLAVISERVSESIVSVMMSTVCQRSVMSVMRVSNRPVSVGRVIHPRVSLSISFSLGLGLSLSLLPVDSLYGSSSLFSRSCSSYGSHSENSASEGTRNKSSGIVGTSSVVGVNHGGMNYGSMVNCVRQEVATKTVCKGRVCLSLRRSHQGENQQELHDDTP